MRTKDDRAIRAGLRNGVRSWEALCYRILLRSLGSFEGGEERGAMGSSLKQGSLTEGGGE